MLALKLALVPAVLLAVSLAGGRWGPGVAGWLAGLPVVAGPILWFLALEHGTVFAADAATAALAAVTASVTFGLAYAHAARRATWPLAAAAGVLAWALAVSALSTMPWAWWGAGLVAGLALLLGPGRFPRVEAGFAGRRLSRAELLVRMAAGALLTLAVTGAAAGIGPRWSGLLAVFPVLGVVLAVSTHRQQGGASAALLLRGMARGLASFALFCLALGASLVALGVPLAFALASGVALATQAATGARASARARAAGGRPADPGRTS